eukprot:TRINITY_DN3623_c0_g1_i5.p1 TRINITY_DN3623_c0_g1~~TRINITY_DN3623_c0_g1_i5.p1  ORF type:complete len:866 (-),score=166.88 TRINITY_DN3623_c0_g1_i5:80-2677(-)
MLMSGQFDMSAFDDPAPAPAPAPAPVPAPAPAPAPAPPPKFNDVLEYAPERHPTGQSTASSDPLRVVLSSHALTLALRLLTHFLDCWLGPLRAALPDVSATWAPIEASLKQAAVVICEKSDIVGGSEQLLHEVMNSYRARQSLLLSGLLDTVPARVSMIVSACRLAIDGLSPSSFCACTLPRLKGVHNISTLLDLAGLIQSLPASASGTRDENVLVNATVLMLAFIHAADLSQNLLCKQILELHDSQSGGTAVVPPSLRLPATLVSVLAALAKLQGGFTTAVLPESQQDAAEGESAQVQQQDPRLRLLPLLLSQEFSSGAVTLWSSHEPVPACLGEWSRHVTQKVATLKPTSLPECSHVAKSIDADGEGLWALLMQDETLKATWTALEAKLQAASRRVERIAMLSASSHLSDSTEAPLTMSFHAPFTLLNAHIFLKSLCVNRLDSRRVAVATSKGIRVLRVEEIVASSSSAAQLPAGPPPGSSSATAVDIAGANSEAASRTKLQQRVSKIFDQKKRLPSSVSTLSEEDGEGGGSGEGGEGEPAAGLLVSAAELPNTQASLVQDNKFSLRDFNAAKGSYFHRDAYARRSLAFQSLADTSARYSASDMNAKWVESHPNMPLFLSGGYDGAVHLWDFDDSRSIATFRSSGPEVNRIRFEQHGNKFALCDSDGGLTLFPFEAEPHISHSERVKTGFQKLSDFSFLESPSLLAAVGLHPQQTNLLFYDTLLPTRDMQTSSLPILEGGCVSVAYIPSRSLIIAGGARGSVTFVDSRQRQVISTVSPPAHAKSKILHVAVHPSSMLFVTAANDGTELLWDAATLRVVADWSATHEKRSLRATGSSSLVFILKKKMQNKKLQNAAKLGHKRRC